MSRKERLAALCPSPALLPDLDDLSNRFEVNAVLSKYWPGEDDEKENGPSHVTILDLPKYHTANPCPPCRVSIDVEPLPEPKSEIKFRIMYKFLHCVADKN